MLAKVGETFAASASRLLSSLSTLGPLPRGLQARLGAVSAEVGRLEALGVRIQEIARVLGGQAPLPPERMDFAGAVRAVLGQWAPPSRVAGVRVVAPDDPVQVELNAAVLAQLLGLAVECALQVGPVVEVRVEGSGQPTLTVRTDRPSDAGTNDEGEELGDLHWTLFALLARAVGLLPQRLVAGRTVSMTLRFPEAEAGARREGPARTATPAGRRVLLVEPRESARVAAHDLLHDAGMRVDAAASLEQADESLRGGAPDIVVAGLPTTDAGMAALLERARAAQPRLRVVQLVDDDDAFAFSGPGLDDPAQVGRRHMARTLVSAVAQELDAA
ncbi:MAG TPA: response regulator [Burkholderiaceae bacterium]